MTYIGILDANRREMYLEFMHYLADYKGLSLDSINICENLDDADVIIIDSIPEDTRHLENMHPKVIIVNSDSPGAMKLALNRGGQIITYGFNPKSSITASSVLDNNIMIYVQRAIYTITGDSVFPGEFSLEGAGSGGFIDCAMGGVAAALVCGIFP